MPAVARSRTRIAAAVALMCALVGTLGAAAGAEAAPLVGAAAASETRVTMGALLIDGLGTATSSTVGNGGSLVLSGGYADRWTGTRATPHVLLERRVGSGAWTTTHATVSATSSGLVVRTPAYSTSRAVQAVAYRLRSVPTAAGVVNTSLSKPITVVYENQGSYTGFARTVYRAVQRYCPTTAVHVGALAAGAGDYRTGTLLIRVAAAVRRYAPIDVRAVALHECSHEHQWLDYGGTSAGWRTMQRDAGRVFSDWRRPAGATTPYPYRAPVSAITPVEHAADCGAQSVNRGGYVGYGGYCTAAELRAGKRLLEGRRY